MTSLYDVPIPGVVRVCKMIARSPRSSLIRRRDHEAVKTSEVRTCYSSMVKISVIIVFFNKLLNIHLFKYTILIITDRDFIIYDQGVGISTEVFDEKRTSFTFI